MHVLIKISIVFLVFTLIIPPGFAQVPEEFKEIEELSIVLEHRDVMLSDEEYPVQITLNEPSADGSLVIVSVDDSSIIDVPQSVFISKHSNHGIFTVMPKKEGTVTIYAVYSGYSTEGTITVVSQQSNPESLQVFLTANKTKANQINGYVYSIDGKGSPVKVDSDLIVSLGTDDSLHTDSKIIIKNGTFSQSFILDVGGSGTVFASAKNMKPGESTITKELEAITLHLEVAPNIILDNSIAYFFLWLEQDGKPFNPPYAIDVQLSSSDYYKARLTKQMPQYQTGEIFSSSMVDGFMYGELYTGLSGIVTISASVANIGSVHKTVVIGDVEVGDSALASIQDNSEITIAESTNEERIEEAFGNPIANIVQIFAYPNPTSGKALGVLAPYFINFTDTMTVSIDSENNNTASIDEDLFSIDVGSAIIPLKTDGRTIYLSSNGLDHDASVTLLERNIVTHAVLFEISSFSDGDFVLAASGPSLLQSQTNLEVRSPSTNDYEFHVVKLPIVANEKQDLAIISIVEKDSGTHTDVKKTFGIAPSLTIQPTSDSLSDLKLTKKNNSWVLQGYVENSGSAIISGNEVGLSNIDIVPAGIPVGLDLWVPNKVHVGEVFPYSLHEIDAFDNPIRKTVFSAISAPSLLEHTTNGFIAHSPKSISITVLGSQGGATTVTTDAFSNPMSLLPTLDFSEIRVGKEVVLDVSTDADANIKLDSPIPYEKIDKSTFVLSPTREGSYEITVIAEKTGYSTKLQTVDLLVKNEIDLRIDAMIDERNYPLNVDGELVIGNEEPIRFSTPFSEIVRPGPMTLSVPESYSSGDNNYLLSSVFVDGIEHSSAAVTFAPATDSKIDINYAQLLNVKVDGAHTVSTGKIGESFLYGSTVKLIAQDKQEFGWPFVRNVFDSWSGLPQHLISNESEIEFVIEENVYGKIVYVKDYLILIISFALSLTAGAILLYFKKNGYRKLLALLYDAKDSISYLLPSNKKSNNEPKIKEKSIIDDSIDSDAFDDEKNNKEKLD